MTDKNKSLKVFNMPGNIRFSVTPGRDKTILSAQELSDLADFFEQNSVLNTFNQLAAFVDDKGISIPEFIVRSGTTELVIRARSVAPTTEVATKKIPWYKKIFRAPTPK